MLQFYGDIVINTGTFRDGDANNNVLITVDSGPRFRKYDLETLAQSYTEVTTLTNPVGITLIDSSSAVIVSSTVASVDFIELSGGYRQNYTSGAVAASTVGLGKGQQIDADTASKIAFSVADNITGKVMKINGNTFTISTHVLSGVTSTITTVLMFDGATGAGWLLGTNDGKIHEIDSTPTVVKTLTLPTTPNTGTAPTFRVSGLSYHNDRLAVMTAEGILFIYKYSTSTELRRVYLGSASSGGNFALGSSLCPSASGPFLYSPNYNKISNNSTVSEYDLNDLNVQETYSIELNQKSCPSVGIDKVNFKGWAMIDTTRIRIFNLNSREKTAIQTRIQDPAGTDTTGRIIRIKTPKIGLAAVDIDQNIAAGAVDINSQKEMEYIELAIRTDSPNRWDIRRMHT